MPVPETTQEIEALIAGFKLNDGDLLPALHRIQGRFGYIPREAIPAIARRFGTTPAKIYGALTFYSEFRMTPPPETAVDWCSGPACRLKGSDRILQALQSEFGVGLGGNTPDNKLGLHERQCDGSCRFAPLVWVDDRVHGCLDTTDAIRLARSLKDAARRQGRTAGEGEGT